MVYTLGAQIIENTFHVQKGTPFTALQLQGLTNVFDAWDSTGATRWGQYRPAGTVLQQIKTRALDTAASPVWIFVLPVARAGIKGGTSLPNNATFAVTLQTGLAGRSQRGRIYVPGLTTQDIQAPPNQNTLNAVNANQFVTSMGVLIANVAAIGAGYNLVVTSYRTGGAWRAAGQNSVILNAAYANLFIDTQRRRLPH
jgi:hypothetical protein